MARYSYRAYDSESRIRKGFVDASSTAAAIEQLEGRDLVVVEVLEAGRSKKIRKGGRGLKLEEQADFCRNVSSYLKSGLHLADTLRILSKQSQGRRIGDIYSLLLEDVEGGKTFASSLRETGFFRESVTGVIESGEKSGNLTTVLDQLAEQLGVEVSLQRKVRSALTYPVVMTVIGIGVITFLLAYVVPRLSSLFEDLGQALPLPTRILIFLSYWVKTLAIPGLILFLVLLLVYRKKGRKGLPFFRKIRKKVTFALVSSHIATLLESGIPLVQALRMSSTMDSEPERWTRVAEHVKAGYRFDKAMEKEGSFPDDMIYIIRVGEMGGDLPGSLRRISENYWETSKSLMESMTNLIEPVMVLFLGIAVGFVVVSILLPIFDLSSLVR